MNTKPYTTRVRALLGYVTDQPPLVPSHPLVTFQYDLLTIDDSVEDVELSDFRDEVDDVALPRDPSPTPAYQVSTPVDAGDPAIVTQPREELTSDDPPFLCFQQPVQKIEAEQNKLGTPADDLPASDTTALLPTLNRSLQSANQPTRTNLPAEPQPFESAPLRSKDALQPVQVEVPGRTLKPSRPLPTQRINTQDEKTANRTPVLPQHHQLEVQQPSIEGGSRTSAYEQRQEAIDHRAQVIREQLIQQFASETPPVMPSTMSPKPVLEQPVTEYEQKHLQEEIEQLRSELEELECELNDLQSRPAPSTTNREVIVVTSKRPQTAAFWERRYQGRLRSHRMR